MNHLTVGDPVLPKVRTNLVRPTAPVRARIASSALCMKGRSASFVRHVAIDVSGTPLEGAFLPGQSFGIVPPGIGANGKPHPVRLYSSSCPSWGEDGQGRVISTTLKRLIDERRPQREGDDPRDHRLFTGLCSNHACDLAEGDEVLVSGPNGRSFLLPEDTEAHDYLFVATGTGIAPFRGMAMELFDRPSGPTRSQVHLVMGSPYTTDLLYDEQMRSLAERHENFHYHTAISRETRPDGRRGLYVDGYIDERMEELFGGLLDRERTLIHVCGLAGMQIGLFRVLAAHGLASGYLNVRDESLAGIDPRGWTDEQVRQGIRPTRRCMLEVY
jgi:ferredoxin--NADP+ reductase